MINKLNQTNTTEDNRGYQAKKTVLATIDFPFLKDDTILNCIHCSHSDKDYIVATTRLSNTQVFVGQIIISNQNDDNDQDSIPDLQIKTLGQYPFGNAMHSRIFPLITEKSFLIHEGADLHKVDLETGTILWSVKTISRHQRFVEDERGIIYSVPDCGDYIYLMDTRTGQLLDKRKLKVSNSNSLTLSTYGLAYDILNCNLILSTNVFGKNYWYTSFHLSRQMTIERKTLHSQIPNHLDFDIFKKKIFSMPINPNVVECYDLDYKEKVTIQTHALGNPISFFLFKDCKYLAIITGKQLIVMN